MLAFLRRWFVYRDVTQTDARTQMRAAMAGLKPPTPAREGYDTPIDRKVRIPRFGLLQQQANRILDQRRA